MFAQAMAFHFSKILYFGSALQVAHMRMRKCGVTTRRVDRRGSGHLAGYRVYLARVGVRVRFLNPVKTLTPSTGVAGFSGIFSHSRFLFHFFFANLLFFFRSCYIFIADRHGRARPHNRWPRQRDLSTRLPAPYPPFRRRPLPRGPGPLGPTTRHLPTATRATTRGEDKTRRRHPHAPHRAPRRLAAAPTTNGHDGDDTWRGQNTPTPPARAASCPSHPHAPHRARRGCARHAHRGCTRHAPSTVAAASRAHSASSSLPRAPTPRTLRWWLPQPHLQVRRRQGSRWEPVRRARYVASRRGRPSHRRGPCRWLPLTHRRARRSGSHTASDCRAQHSSGSPCTTQQWIAVRDPVADRYARRSSSGSLCAAQQSSGSLCTTQQQITVHDAAADRRARCSSSTWSKAWTRRIPSRVRYGVPGLT